MDYDDNDFQGHNLHLAGEGSSRISPVLHPYALPKFDFDDSLQAHLRFDSLVENEVFLGIPSQEDNHWIEDFSRGSSGVEFSSSAAESCSIPRRHNVWSEATSSESVEMLLKSVGQEEMVPVETTIEESDAADELGGLTAQMEPDSNAEDRVKDVIGAHPVIPPDELLEKFSGFNGSSSGEPQHVNCPSLIHVAEISAYGSSSELLQDAGSKKGTVLVTEENLGLFRKCDDGFRNEVDASVNDHLPEKKPEDSSVCAMQVENIDSASQNVSAKSDQHLSHTASNICLGEKEHVALSENVSSEDDKKIKGSALEVCGSALHGAQKVEFLEEHAHISIPKEPCVLQTAEQCDEVEQKSLCSIQSCEHEGFLSSRGMETDQHSKDDMLDDRSVVFEGDTFEGNVAEVSKTKKDTNANLQLEVGSLVPATNDEVHSIVEEENLNDANLQIDDVASVSNSGKSLLSGVDSESPKQGDGGIIDHVLTPASFTVSQISTEWCAEKGEIMKSSGDVSGDNKNLDTMAPVNPLMLSVPFQIREVIISDVRDTGEDVSLNEKGCDGLPTDSSHSECDNVIRVGTDGKIRPDEVVKESKVDTNTGDKLALNVSREESGAVIACGSESDMTVGNQSGSAIVDQSFVRLDEKEEKKVDVPMEASLAILQPPSEVNNGPGLVSEVDRGASPDLALQMVPKRADQPSPMVVTYDVATPSTKSNAGKVVDSQNYMETSAGHCDSIAKDGNGGEAVALVGHERTVLEINHAVDPVNDADAVCSSSKDQTKTEYMCLSAGCDMGPKHEEGTESIAGSKVDDGGKTSFEIRVDNSNNPWPSQGDGSYMLERGGGSAEPESPTIISSTVPSQNPKEKPEGIKDAVVEHLSNAKVVEGLLPTSGGGPTESKMALEIPHQSTQSADFGMAHGSAKNTAERKTRRSSGKSAVKENARKGSHSKGTSGVRRSDRGDKSLGVIMSPSGVSQPGQFEESKVYGNVEHIGTKPTGAISIPTSNLPDLNSSAPAVLFQQPFTDLQQVQLRAQIFVYGSLIQGVAPEEACMISAFGSADDGRIVWEPSWRTCLERLHGQKSLVNNIETPKQSRTGAKAPDLATKQGSIQNKAHPPPVSRANSKGTPPVVNSMMPLSSPLWSISTPGGDGLQPGVMRGTVLDYQTLTPLNPYQTTPVRNVVGHNASWLSQSPFPGPWTQTSAFDANARFPVLPVTETVKLTPVKESALPNSSSSKHASISTVQSGVPSLLSGTSSLLDTKKVTVSPVQQLGETKVRKRKKAALTEHLSQVPLAAPTPTEPTAAAVISSHFSKKVPANEDVGRTSLLARATETVAAPVASVMSGQLSTPVTPACFTHKSNDKLVTDVFNASSIDHGKRGDNNVEKKTGLSEETLNKLGEAKLQAEDAAAHAAFAVGHCQGVWSELDKQKSSGFVSDVEAKLASAAVAISAAASVAKAAAAAAKIASLAAAQAKLMVDEALVSSETGNLVANNFGNATPASILKVGDSSNASSSILVAAREAARRKVEAASAASRHAENIDAIVKAAELAAEAVSQAGKIVAMGDPLPLSELVAAGEEGHWKLSQKPSEPGPKLSSANVSQSSYKGVGEDFNASAKQLKEGPAIVVQTTSIGGPFSTEEISKDPVCDHLRVVDGERFSRGQRGRKATDSAKENSVVPESEIGSRSFMNVLDEYNNASGMLKDIGMKENSPVEVFKDTGNVKAAWFSASVLSLKDKKAYVCYTTLDSDEGSGKLKEWVSLEGEAHKAPRIRIPHPMTAVWLDGTRKRRRGLLRDYAWAIGDKVDAWIHDCWREGVITEKNKKDETSLTVHFPAEGESSVVRVWDLRPTLIWSNNEQWIEWSGSREERPSQGDTPQEKRLKLGNPTTEGKDKDMMPKDFDLLESGRQEESRSLPLSASEKVFNVGKNTRDKSTSGTLRTSRTGLQKESKVIFGIPKPGKKRKFMEVSKHYIGHKSSKSDPADDSVKFAKFLMPQSQGLRAWRNSSKIDSKKKQAAESKPKVRTGKLQTVSGRTLPHKDFSVTAVSSSNDTVITEHRNNDSMSNDENRSQQLHLMESGSVSNADRAAKGAFLFSTLAVPRDVLSKKPKPLTSNTKSEQANKGRLAPAGGMLSKVEVKDKSGPEVVGTRRSNRRIQPTSRLLEGLQSSLIISKLPSVSHDRSHKSQNRGGSRGNNNG